MGLKICDRCHLTGNEPVKAVTEIVFGVDIEAFDLCQSCVEKVRQFINEPEVRRGRKRASVSDENA